MPSLKDRFFRDTLYYDDIMTDMTIKMTMINRTVKMTMMMTMIVIISFENDHYLCS